MNFINSTHAEKVRVSALTATQAFAAQDMSKGKSSVDVGRFSMDFDLSTKQVAILNRLHTEYTDDFVLTVLKPLLDQKGDVSLRSLDWLCTNYSKHTNLSCKTKDGKIFNIHQGYKRALSYYRRRNFDPFRRRLRITVHHPEGSLTSTIGQLNYLHWCHVNGVLDFAFKNAKEVEKDMSSVTHRSRRQRQQDQRQGRKVVRRELTRVAPSKLSIYPFANVSDFS